VTRAADQTVEPRRGAGTVAAILRFLIGGVLVATGVGKLLNVPGFARVLGNYRTFPDPLLMPVAVAVPVAEVLLGAWLFSGRRLFAAAVAAFAIHLAYAAWSASALMRGLRLANCGCFGVFLPRPLGWSTVIEDLVMAGVCAALAFVAARAERA
jgi:uncharacterized membrane protein YphA (DoxX/SURF4 family)